MIDPPETIGATTFQQPKRSSKKQIEGQTELLLPIAGVKEPASTKYKGNRSIRPVDIEVTRPSLGVRKTR
jgi:hypothetical protein